MSSVVEVFRGDNGALVVNASQIGLGPIAEAVNMLGDGDPFQQQAMAAMASWANAARPPAGRQLHGIFDRNAYVAPDEAYGKMRVARRAASKDDIVGRAMRTTEALSYRRVEIRCADLDQKDLWNQIAADLNLDARLRELHRVLFTDSQAVVATWWGRKTYKLRRKTKGGQTGRRSFDLTVPLAMSLIDTTRVTPIGILGFNQERLAFIATPLEAEYLDAMLARRDGLPVPRRSGLQRETTVYNDFGQRMLEPTVPESGMVMIDPVMARLITGRYVPDYIENEQLRADGVDPTHLFAFDPRFVFRHCRTRPQFQRFASVDLEIVFELLDAKRQLRQVDRAHLIGGANYIVLITKGTDQRPAEQTEIDNLRAHVKVMGQIPFFIGDHRLNIEIVTPKQDHVLSQEKHDVIDNRISAAVYGMFTSTGKGNDDPLKAGRLVATGLESERHMLGRSLEALLFQSIRDANPNTLTERAKLVHQPGSISLTFDSSWATFLLDMREGRMISRDTLLSQMGLDQADEALLMQLEAEEYDPIFKEMVPHSANPGQQQVAVDDPAQQRSAQRRAGRRQGGTKDGGGRAPGTQQGKESVDPRRSDTGPTRRPRADVAEAIAEITGGPVPDTWSDVQTALVGLPRPQLVAIAGAVEQKVPRRHRLRAEDLAAAILERADDVDDDEDPT